MTFFLSSRRPHHLGAPGPASRTQVSTERASSPVAAEFLLLLLTLPVSICFAVTPPTSLSAAEHHLNLGLLDQTIAELKPLTAANPANAEAHLLLCRAFYAEKQADAAIAECEAATQGTLAHSSTAFDWLGRAYGQRAALGGPITGLRTAPKVRDAFEHAVALDPRDHFSVADLGEFYADAPGVVGGGADKAHALADRSMSSMPQTAHRIHAMAAEGAHDYGTAEREFRAAVAVANRADAWADLGDYFGRRKNYDAQLNALQHAIALDKPLGPTTVDCAESLINVKRHLDLAEQWLRAYLTGGVPTDDQPIPKVHTLLGKLLAKRGDKNGARAEYNKALSLAKDFEPAQKALGDL